MTKKHPNAVRLTAEPNYKHIIEKNRATLYVTPGAPKAVAKDAKTATPTAQERALTEAAKEFFNGDYLKILKAQKVFTYPCSAKELEAWELCMYQNYLNRERSGDWVTFLYLLEELLKKEYPQALTAWHDLLKKEAVKGGFIDWAKSHPKEVF